MKTLRRWWFRLWHPEFCYDCGGHTVKYECEGGPEWACPACELRRLDEERERSERRHRELFG